MKKSFLKRKKDIIRENKLEFVNNMESTDDNVFLPYSLSVDKIRRLSEGRDKQPRMKKKENSVTDYCLK